MQDKTHLQLSNFNHPAIQKVIFVHIFGQIYATAASARLKSELINVIWQVFQPSKCNCPAPTDEGVNIKTQRSAHSFR